MNRESEQERQLILEMMKKQTPFKPKINATSSRDREDEAYVPVFERLSSTGDSKVLMDEVLTKIKAEIELRGCTFQPQMLTKKKQQPATPQPQDPPVSVVRPTVRIVHIMISLSRHILIRCSGSRPTEYGSRGGQGAAGEEGHTEADRGFDELGFVLRPAAAGPVRGDRPTKKPRAERHHRNGPP